MHWIICFLQDVVFGARNLLKIPAFSVVALGSIALGIGASAAMYSVMDAVVLNPFVYADVDRLVSIQVVSPDQQRGNGSYYSVDQFLELAGRSTVFEGVIAGSGLHCEPDAWIR